MRLFRSKKKEEEKNIVLGNPIYPSTEEVTPKEIKKSRFSFTNYLIYFLIAVAITVGISAYLIYQTYTKFTYTDVIEEREVKDNTITKAIAEAKNLALVEKKFKEDSLLVKGDNKTFEDITSADSTYNTFKSHEISADYSITKSQFADRNEEFIPTYFILYKTVQDNQLDYAKIVQAINDDVVESAYSEVILDATLTEFPMFLEIYTELKAELEDVKINVVLYPRWGDEVEYRDFYHISNTFHESEDFVALLNIADGIIVQGYGFTNEFSILPGSTTPVSWAEKVIQYYIYKGVDREKLSFEINTQEYVWREREIESSSRDNFSSATEQAIINMQDLEEVDLTSEEKEAAEAIQDHEVKKYLKDNLVYIGVSPNDENIESVKKLVGLYGLKGYVLR